MKKIWPMLHKQALEGLNEWSISTALETDNIKNLPKVRNVTEDQVTEREGTLLEHFNKAKLSIKQQAHIDLLLFKFIICCAIPFNVLDNTFFCDFVTALAFNYVVPDRSTFFARYIAQETATYGFKLRKYLKDHQLLTLSFDGWSTRANDKVYTFHTTTST